MVSPAGAIANVLWFEIQNHAQPIEYGEFVVMPNHIHGILILNTNHHGDGAFCDRDVTCNVPTMTPPESVNKNEEMSAISPKPNSVSTIIRSYKLAVTKYCNRMQIDFGWQPRFYDHIIRDQRISYYIKTNPIHWTEDQFHSIPRDG